MSGRARPRPTARTSPKAVAQKRGLGAGRAAEELAFMYFPENYRWSHGMLLAIGGAPWGGGTMDEAHRVGLRLRGRVGDDGAWFREWTRWPRRWS